MATLKVTSWNVEHFRKVFQGDDTGPKQQRRAAVARELQEIDPDVLCMIEGPKDPAVLQQWIADDLGGAYAVVQAGDGEYGIQGVQWIWFLVKSALVPSASLLPVATWDAFSAASWTVHYWGNMSDEQHKHYRHPQVLVLDVAGIRVEMIGLHLKSKFVNSGESDWKSGDPARQRAFIEGAIKARIKLATEASNVRAYIETKFSQVPNPAIFVMGDLNDGPGKEKIEDQYLFFDLLSNIQGDVFFARRFLNHALFDAQEDLRWSVFFKDFMDPDRPPQILLDHILFTQGLCDGSLPLEVKPHAGLVEHEMHDLVNASLPSAARTSDHKPVSVVVSVA